MVAAALTAAQSASAVEIPDGVFNLDYYPVEKLELICHRDWDLQTCALPTDFQEELENSKKEFFSGAEERSKFLSALQKEALDAADLYRDRAGKCAGKSKILVTIYEEARQEVLKSDYLSELKVAQDANGPTSEAHAQFQKLSDLGAKYEATRQLPLSERAEVRAALLEEYKIALNLIQRFWNIATYPSDNYPRLRPTIRPIAESSTVDPGASLSTIANYHLIPADTQSADVYINLLNDRKLLEALVFDSTGRENPIRIDEKEAGFFERPKLRYDAASRTLTHRYRYNRDGDLMPSTKPIKLVLKELLGVK